MNGYLNKIILSSVDGPEIVPPFVDVLDCVTAITLKPLIIVLTVVSASVSARLKHYLSIVKNDVFFSIQHFVLSAMPARKNVIVTVLLNIKSNQPMTS